jgi:pyrroline-5-carboxylate reductase
MKIGVIGTGTIASAVITGIANEGHQIVVSNRSAAKAERLKATFPNIEIADNQSVIDASDVIFLGTTAEVADQVLAELVFRPDQRVISFMVGISARQILALVAPASFDSTMIPFPSIAHGGSPVLVCPESALVKSLFETENTIFSFETTDQMDAYLTAQAVLSPALKVTEVAAQWLAKRTGDTAIADQFLRLLVGSTLSSSSLLDALTDLNTPGGLNAELREHLAELGGYDAVLSGLDRLERRLAEPTE